MNKALAYCLRTASYSLGLLACVILTGCAAITNPVANGVPVRILPPELLAETKEDTEPISLALLRQKPVEQYRLDSGDTLGVYIEGVFGDADTPPPVNISEGTNMPPSMGYPIPVRTDGTLPVPLVNPVPVKGLTLEEAESAITKAYEAKDILRPDDRRILVTLMRPRQTRVFVMREDSPERRVTIKSRSLRGLGTSRTTIGGDQRGTGSVLELPAYENDVLNALAQTGGMPSGDAVEEVIIQRGYGTGANVSTQMPEGFDASVLANPADATAARTIRIPLRIFPGETAPFKPEDVILQTGDIVIVRSRKPEFYYTGGLLPAQEVPMPNDYDLTAVEAVLKIEGPLLNGGINPSNLNGELVASGIGNPSPSLLTILRKTPDGGQVAIRIDMNQALRDPRENILVQAGDILLLQETPGEAMARYVSEIFDVNIFARFLNRGDALGTAEVALP